MLPNIALIELMWNNMKVYMTNIQLQINIKKINPVIKNKNKWTERFAFPNKETFLRQSFCKSFRKSWTMLPWLKLLEHFEVFVGYQAKFLRFYKILKRISLQFYL